MARPTRMAHFKQNVGRFRTWQTIGVSGLVGLLAVGYALARVSPWPVAAAAVGALIPYALRSQLTTRLGPTMWAIKVGGLGIWGASLVSFLAPNVIPVERVVWLHGMLVAIPLYLSTYFVVLSDPEVWLVE